MKCELPTFLRCCFCFPLRYGLLVCSYIKQITNLLFASFLILRIYQRSSAAKLSGWNLWFLVVLLTITILDFGFNVLFIIGGHTKNHKKMRIFYRYCIATQCAYAVLLAFVIFDCVYYYILHPYMWYFFVEYVWIPAMAAIAVLIIMQFYLIILVRSEFLKLKNNAQFEFINREAEEKCTANIDFEIPIPDSI